MQPCECCRENECQQQLQHADELIAELMAELEFYRVASAGMAG